MDTDSEKKRDSYKDNEGPEGIDVGSDRSETSERSNSFGNEHASGDSEGQQYMTPLDVTDTRTRDDGSDKPYYHYIRKDVPIPRCLGDRNKYLVDWLGEDDPEKPQNWPFSKKLYSMSMCAFAAMVTVFGSAIAAPATPEIMKEFHVGLPVALLNVSSYVLGFASGPVSWGPMSEQTGRRLPLIIALFGLCVFSFAAATAKDFQTLVLSRFFGGTFSAGSLAVAPVIPADIFDTDGRGKGIAIISLMIIAGPMVAPVVGGYICSSFSGWRWTFYILGIFTALILILVAFLLPETYSPASLAVRAKKIRSHTNNWTVVAPLEMQESNTEELVERTSLRPLKMLVVEPISFSISLYHGFIYGILYLCLECVPLIFSDYGWHGGNIYSPYLGMLVGTIVVIMVNSAFFEPMFERKSKASGQTILPEERLPLMMMCGIVFPMGIFLLCWSGAYHVMWFVPTLGCASIGFASIGIFMSAFNYIIDTYSMLAASGIAANTFLRSGFGCAFPLFAHPMFVNLGTQWAGTLLGCLAALLAPVPFLFYYFGRRIREKSKYAVAF